MGKIRQIGNDEVLKELQELSPLLAAMPRENPFLVPDNYFTELDEVISASLELKQPEALSNENPFKVPLGYFEELPEKIVAQVSDGDSGSELLAQIKSRNPFLTPAGYFEQLPTSVLQKARQARIPRVRDLAMRFRIVAAAAALVSAVLMTFSLLNRGGESDRQLSQDEVSTYMLANVDEFSEAEIVLFIGDETLIDIASDDSLLNNIDISNYLQDEVDYYQLQDEWL